MCYRNQEFEDPAWVGKKSDRVLAVNAGVMLMRLDRMRALVSLVGSHSCPNAHDNCHQKIDTALRAIFERWNDHAYYADQVAPRDACCQADDHRTC